MLPRIRLVGQRSLPGALALQTVVLATQQKFVTLPMYSFTWVRLRLPKPLPVADAGPSVDQFAVQVTLPAGDDSVWWPVCDGYLRGNGQTDFDPGSAVNRDTGTAVVANLPRGLAFREYNTPP